MLCHSAVNALRGKPYLPTHELTDAHSELMLDAIPPTQRVQVILILWFLATDGCGIFRIHTCDLSTIREMLFCSIFQGEFVNFFLTNHVITSLIRPQRVN